MFFQNSSLNISKLNRRMCRTVGPTKLNPPTVAPSNMGMEVTTISQEHFLLWPWNSISYIFCFMESSLSWITKAMNYKVNPPALLPVTLEVSSESRGFAQGLRRRRCSVGWVENCLHFLIMWCVLTALVINLPQTVKKEANRLVSLT